MRGPLNKGTLTRPSSREVRTRVPLFSVVYFSRGTLPTKTVGKRALLGDPVQVRGSPGSLAARCPLTGLKLNAL